MNEEVLYLKYLSKQISITQNWMSRLEKKMWFLQQCLERETERVSLHQETEKKQIQQDFFVV